MIARLAKAGVVDSAEMHIRNYVTAFLLAAAFLLLVFQWLDSGLLHRSRQNPNKHTMGIYHLVLFEFKSTADPEEVKEAGYGLISPPYYTWTNGSMFMIGLQSNASAEG